MTNYILLAMIMFGGGSLIYGQYITEVGNTPAEIIRNAILVGVGLIGLVVNNLFFIIEALANCSPANKPVPYNPNNVVPIPPSYDDDFLSLVRLRDRFKSMGQKEGVDLTAQLADKLFRGEVK